MLVSGRVYAYGERLVFTCRDDPVACIRWWHECTWLDCIFWHLLARPRASAAAAKTKNQTAVRSVEAMPPLNPMIFYPKHSMYGIL